MSDRHFLDTNVIVYAHDRMNPAKQCLAKDLVLEAVWSKAGVISTQVLGEFFIAVTRKLKRPLSVDKARREIGALRVLNVVDITPDLVTRAIDLHVAHQIRYWDGLILASAAQAGCRILYTEDMNAGQVIAGVRLVNPFR